MRFIKQRFSTGEVSAGRRAAMWSRRVQDINFDFEFEPADGRRYRGSLSRYAVPDFQVVAFDQGTAAFDRGSRHIRRDRIGVVEAFAPSHGHCVIEQFGIRSECPPGSLFLLDAAAPFRLVHHERVAGVILKMSRDAVCRYLPDVRPLCARPLDGSAGLPRIALDFLRAIGREGDWLDGRRFDDACHRLMDLMAMVTTDAGVAPAAGGRVRDATLGRLREFVRGRACDPELGTPSIAAAFGLSERYVQRLFQEAGTTVRGYIREQRLEAARRRLANAAEGGRSITRIAYESGFSSSAHFSSAFRARFGESPRAYRQAALGR